MELMDPTEVHNKLKAKGTKFVSVRFIKKNGEERKMSGLLKPLSHIKGTGRATPDHLVAIWSPREGWRSFDIERVVSVK